MNIRLLTFVGGILMAFLALVTDANSEDIIHVSQDPEFATIYYYQEDMSAHFTDAAQKDAVITKEDPETGLIFMKDNVDSLVYRVKQILGIYPPDLRFNINVYKTYSELTAAFQRLSLTGDAPVAFYSHQYRTIYISAEKLNDTILAHEIAHAVINSYFTPTPSTQMQEVLAHYVEKNLKAPFTRNQSP